MLNNYIHYAEFMLQRLRMLDVWTVMALFLKLESSKDRDVICEHITDNLLEDSDESLMWGIILICLSGCPESYLVDRTLYVSERTKNRIKTVLHKINILYPVKDVGMKIATYIHLPFHSLH